jgi:hypothetical protein
VLHFSYMKAAPLKSNLNAQTLVMLITKEYVKDYNVGANCWRRTEVLTFDGDVLKSLHLTEIPN